jgi:hypothetical protein
MGLLATKKAARPPMTNEEQIQHAVRAKLLLDDPMIKDAFAEIDAAIIGQWRDLSVTNKEQAEELKRLLWASQQFKAIFEVTISGAAVAQNELLNASSMQIRAEAAKRRMYG